MNTLTLYTKSGCHLCDEMKLIIGKVKKEIDFNFEEVDIETDKFLYIEYKEKIPVLMIDGKLFAKYFLDEKKLIRKLR